MELNRIFLKTSFNIFFFLVHVFNNMEWVFVLYVFKLCFSVVYFRRGAGLQATTSKRRGFWRSSLELWQLHPPQPSCTQPLWGMWDATLQLNLAWHCSAHPWPSFCITLETPNHVPQESISRSAPLSINIPPLPPPAEEEPLLLPILWLLLLLPSTTVHYDLFFGCCFLAYVKEGLEKVQLRWSGTKWFMDEEEAAMVYLANIPGRRVTALFTLCRLLNTERRHVYFNPRPVFS